MLIRSRLIDYSRREQRHSRIISLDAPAGEEDTTLGETLADDKDLHEEKATRDVTRAEIEELTRQMQAFGVSLSDVADNCPKQDVYKRQVPKRCALWGSCTRARRTCCGSAAS